MFCFGKISWIHTSHFTPRKAANGPKIKMSNMKPSKF